MLPICDVTKAEKTYLIITECLFSGRGMCVIVEGVFHISK